MSESPNVLIAVGQVSGAQYYLEQTYDHISLLGIM